MLRITKHFSPASLIGEGLTVISFGMSKIALGPMAEQINHN